MFAVAWVFLLASVVLGVLLRWQAVQPWAWFDYPNWLHAHSHAAFLGWVFNAFFALAVREWAQGAQRRFYWTLFAVLQVANLGMLAGFPVQGYGAATIAFSTLHMAGGAVFGVFLWRSRAVPPSARACLRLAVVCMLVSGIGPLALGPMAALGLRDSALYPLSVYWYLHFQYNGWFILFPAAVILARAADRGDRSESPTVALVLLGTGIFLTFLVSALWLDPPGWVRGLALAGALSQLAGGVLFLAAVVPVWSGRTATGGRLEVRLLWVAFSAFFAKAVFQALACLPALSAVVDHRFTAITFLHWVFLLVVLPALVAAALSYGWIRDGTRTRLGLALAAAGIILTKAGLLYPVLAPAVGAPPLPAVSQILLAAAGMQLAGLVFVAIRCAAQRVEPRQGV